MDTDEKILFGDDEAEAAAKKDDDAILRAVQMAVKQFDLEEDTSRLIHLEQIRKNDFFWEGHQELWRDPIDGRTYSVDDAARQGLITWEEVDDYDKNLNIYRGHGESVIAAMSVEVPKTRFYPENPRSALDIQTAKEYRKIVELIELQNNARGKIRKAYFTLWRQHFVAMYIYSHTDEQYGTYTKDVKDFVETPVDVHTCPDCGEGVEMLEPDSYGPREEMGFEDDMMEQPASEALCANCGVVEPMVQQGVDTSYEKVDEEEMPRRRICIEVYGDKHVKVPARTESQEDCIWLIFEKELHIAQLKSMYPEHKDKIVPGSDTLNDKEVRAPVLNPYQTDQTYLTNRLVWLRPAAYEVKEFESVYKLLKEKYPRGVLVPMVEDTALECIDAELDPCWEISCSPISDNIHATPMGQQVLPAQEIDTEVLQLQVDTLRHGIGERYINPAAIDAKTYGKSESAPGMVSPLKPRPTMNLSAEIVDVRGATLPDGATELQNMVNARAQFLAKDYPALHGGPGQGDTATEYSTSLQQNLQSLGLPVDMVREWWMRGMAKAAKLFHDTMEEEEETYATNLGPHAYRTNVISSKRLMGRVGTIFPETSPAFPTGWEGQRNAVKEWMTLFPEFKETALHPENSSMMKELIGVDQLYVPGELDRMKQLIELDELLKQPAQPSIDPATGQPMLDPKTGQPHFRSTVQVDYMDDDAIHIQAIKVWAISDEGMLFKKEQPQIYENVMWHAKEHEAALVAKMPPPPPAPPKAGDVAPAEGGQ